MSDKPLLGFGSFSVKKLNEMYSRNKIFINKEYQRTYVWNPSQRKNLIDTILNGDSMGVLVVWKNKGTWEILDGQQRIKTIVKYLSEDPKENFPDNLGRNFYKLKKWERSKIRKYKVYYIKLKSSLTDDQISQTFIKLQEGERLNIAEKVNAFRGTFKEAFIKIFHERSKIFFDEIKNYRFRSRFLAAQFLLFELKTKFSRNHFPELNYDDFLDTNDYYKNHRLPENAIRNCSKYVNFLGTFLQNQLASLKDRDLVPFYLLLSYLQENQARKEGLGITFQTFVKTFIKNLNNVYLYDTKPPRGMLRKIFKRYFKYKQIGRQAATFESISKRFQVAKQEYKRLFPKSKMKDPIRLFNEDQKIIIYYNQDCKCSRCGEDLKFSKAQCHHKKEHSLGGPTKIRNGMMVHPNCHKKLDEELMRRRRL